MPIEYQRDDRRCLITVTLIDPFTFGELLSQTDRQWSEDTWGYAVLYDTRASLHVIPAAELQQLVEHTRTVGAGRPRGPVGVMIPPRRLRGGLALAKLSGPLRDLEVLMNDAQVEAWVTRNVRRESVGQ
jgi:hypothetical protein